MSLYQDSDRNRIFNEKIASKPIQDPYRSEFWKDYARLIHSAAFRRLQGKTQLYPSHENDYFRTRLTHSLEVAQVSKSIALKLNYENSIDIDLDLIEFAALAHDIGHPPFGHQGEEALDQCMINHGGFEGNAQTLRILTRLEKKHVSKEIFQSSTNDDLRLGLNLTSRSIAAILKYDFPIPSELISRTKYNPDLHPVKGYNDSEREIVAIVKENVLNGYSLKPLLDETGNEKLDANGNVMYEKFKTLECQIMDISDDIAYSTYDLDDTLKGNFCNPFDIAFPNDQIIDKICKKTSKLFNRTITKEEIETVLKNIFKVMIYTGTDEDRKHISNTNIENFINLSLKVSYDAGKQLSQDGQARRLFTSALINRFVSAITLKRHEFLPLSEIEMAPEIRLEIEALKTFNYEVNIQSTRLKTAAYRGKEIVTDIFNILINDNKNGFMLLPDDFKNIYTQCKDQKDKYRTVCDFIAGMTDNYCSDFYARLTSPNPITIFKPH